MCDAANAASPERPLGFARGHPEHAEGRRAPPHTGPRLPHSIGRFPVTLPLTTVRHAVLPEKWVMVSPWTEAMTARRCRQDDGWRRGSQCSAAQIKAAAGAHESRDLAPGDVLRAGLIGLRHPLLKG